MAFHIGNIPNSSSEPGVRHCEVWHKGMRIRRKTRTNLFCFPPEVVNGIHAVPKGGLSVQNACDLLRSRRSKALLTATAGFRRPPGGGQRRFFG